MAFKNAKNNDLNRSAKQMCLKQQIWTCRTNIADKGGNVNKLLFCVKIGHI